jgi:hypothetical protein
LTTILPVWALIFVVFSIHRSKREKIKTNGWATSSKHQCQHHSCPSCLTPRVDIIWLGVIKLRVEFFPLPSFASNTWVYTWRVCPKQIITLSLSVI